LNDVWSTSDGRTFIQENIGTSFLPKRYFSSCVIDSNDRIYTTGGQYDTGNDALPQVFVNDVWTSSIVGGALRPWRRLPTPLWSPRSEHLLISGITPLYNKETLYLIGGLTNSTERATPGAFNDVWSSGDFGLSWELLTREAPFGDRWGHGGFVTSGGAILIIGGSDWLPLGALTVRDVWASFDGGRIWSKCALPSLINDRTFIRGEQGMVLTDTEELVIVSGYYYFPLVNRQNFRDVWSTSFSLSDTDGLRNLCRNQTTAEIQEIERNQDKLIRALKKKRNSLD